MRTKPTIAGLQRKVEELEATVKLRDERVNGLKDHDLQVRTKLSELLDSYTYENDGFGRMRLDREKKVCVEDWLGIAFMIGELKADANYSCVLEAKENFRNESREKDGKIAELQAIIRGDETE